jgi:hypothetical protein
MTICRVDASNWKGPASMNGRSGDSTEALGAASKNTLFFDDFGDYMYGDENYAGGDCTIKRQDRVVLFNNQAGRFRRRLAAQNTASAVRRPAFTFWPGCFPAPGIKSFSAAGWCRLPRIRPGNVVASPAGLVRFRLADVIPTLIPTPRPTEPWTPTPRPLGTTTPTRNPPRLAQPLPVPGLLRRIPGEEFDPEGRQLFQLRAS